MSTSAAARKPLGVRATPEQHRILTEAARREHRSVSSFVLSAALKAANTPTERPRKSPEEVRAAVRRLQELVRPHLRSGQLLSDELIADRRAEAARE